MTMALYWLIAMVILIVFECISLGLTTIWFAAGALAAAIAAALGANMVVQGVVFVIITTILLVFTRPWAMKYLNNRVVKTNADSMVGKTGIVSIDVDNLKEEGQIQIKGSYWTARSLDNQVIEKGAKVVVKEINGVICTVEKV